jgi:hypothetical protein
VTLAALLNTIKVRTRRGGMWTAKQVIRVMAAQAKLAAVPSSWSFSEPRLCKHACMQFCAPLLPAALVDRWRWLVLPVISLVDESPNESGNLIARIAHPTVNQINQTRLKKCGRPKRYYISYILKQ